MVTDAPAVRREEVPESSTGRGLGHLLVRNTAWNFIGQSFLMAMSFVATPFFVHHFGPAQYGVFMVLMALMNLGSLFELGLNASLVKYTAELMPGDQKDEISRFLGTALLIFTAIAVCIGAATTATAGFLVRSVFHTPRELQHVAATSLTLACASFSIRFIAQAYSAIPIAAQRFDVVNKIYAATEFMRVVLAMGVILLGWRLVGVFAVTLAASCLFLICNMWTAKQIVPGLRLAPAYSHVHFRRMFHFSKFLAISTLNANIGDNLDQMLVAYLLPVSSFGYYAVPYNLCRKLWILVGNVKAVVFPTVSALSAGEQSFQVRQLYLRGSKVVAAVLIFPGAVLSLLSHELLLHWISRDFADRGALTLSLLSVGNVVNGLMHIPDSLSQACGHPQLRAKLTGLQAALHAVLFVLLIPFFGLAGAAAGYVLAQLALAPWLIDKVNRIVGVTWKDVVLRCYLPVSIPTVAGCTVIMALRQFIHSFSTLACVVAAGSAIYGLLALWLSFDQKEKSVCLSFVGRA